MLALWLTSIWIAIPAGIAHPSLGAQPQLAARSTQPPKPKKVVARVLQPARHRAPTRAVSPPKPSFPPVELYAVNLGEVLHFRPYDAQGKPRKGADRELTRILRCWHTGRTHTVDPRLGRVLYQVARHYPGHRLEIFSGFRPRQYCDRAHSRHLTASAIDFRIDGVRNEQLVAWLRATFHPAGVGYYPNGVHVHLDVDRERDTYWIDAGDAPKPGPDGDEPLAAIGDTAPGSIDSTADEAVQFTEPSEPPADDPGLDF